MPLVVDDAAAAWLRPDYCCDSDVVVAMVVAPRRQRKHRIYHTELDELQPQRWKSDCDLMTFGLCCIRDDCSG